MLDDKLVMMPQMVETSPRKKGNLRLVLIGLALVVAGFAAAEAPSLFLDLMFLHEARLQQEQLVRMEKAKQLLQQQPPAKPPDAK